jgi:hypothetical protein
VVVAEVDVGTREVTIMFDYGKSMLD